MDPGGGFLSPPAALPQALSLPVLDLNETRLAPSAGLTVAALPKDENDQGNIVKSSNASAMNPQAPAAFNLSPEQILNAPAGVIDAPMPHPESNMKAVTILNDASNAIAAPLPLQPVTDVANNVSVDAKALISPPAAFTPGAHATPSILAADPLASPVRPAANPRATPLPSPIPPASVGKQELNDAAMALTWLAEALTVPGAVSPMVPANATKAQNPSPYQYTTTATDRRRKPANNNAVTPYAAAAGMHNANNNSALYTTPYVASLAGATPLTTTNSGSLRGRRAASQRCSTVVQETILNDRLLNCNPRSLQEGYTPTPRTATATATQTPATAAKRTGVRNSEAALAASAERKSKGYSENSRVGRAMVSILKYVQVHQPEYREITASGGVPERIIRQEFGNNPDTSKALRFLVSEKKIVRKGLGGRRDPFNYILSNAHASLAAAAAVADSIAGETAVAIAVAAAVAAGDTNGLPSSPSEFEGMDREAKSAATAGGATTLGVSHASMAAPGTAIGHLPSATPAAAAATLTAPSTGKWPTTVPRRVGVNYTMKGRKPSQPRLSLGMADPIALEEGRAAAVRDAVLAKQHVAGTGRGVVGAKRPAPTSNTPKTVSFQDNHVAKRPAQQQEQQQQLPGESPATAAVPHAAAFLTPAPNTTTQQQQQQQQWTGPWPTQLPSGQRLTSLASPPPLSTNTPATTNPVFLLPTAAGQGFSAGTVLSATQQQQQQAAHAYLLQLKAAQMLWNHQVLAVQRVAAAAQQQQQQMALAASQAGGNTTLVSPQQQQQMALTTAAPVPATTVAAAPATVTAAGTNA